MPSSEYFERLFYLLLLFFFKSTLLPPSLSHYPRQHPSLCIHFCAHFISLGGFFADFIAESAEDCRFYVNALRLTRSTSPILNDSIATRTKCRLPIGRQRRNDNASVFSFSVSMDTDGTFTFIDRKLSPFNANYRIQEVYYCIVKVNKRISII